MKSFSLPAQTITADSFRDGDFEAIVFHPVLNIRHNRYLPNLAMTLDADCFISITDTMSGDEGVIFLTRGVGNETITLNGCLSYPLKLPVDVGVAVLLRYINSNGLLYWYCLNEN